MSERSETAMRGDSKESGGAAFREASRHHTLAIEIAIAVIAPTLGGHWLDTRIGKGPWFTIAGLILGAAAAFRSVQRTHHESQRALESDRDSRNPAGAESSK